VFLFGHRLLWYYRTTQQRYYATHCLYDSAVPGVELPLAASDSPVARVGRRDFRPQGV
jgi:hypothetical protein